MATTYNGVMTKNQTVYSGPSSSTPKVGTAKKNAAVSVRQTAGSWVNINNGWVPKSTVKKKDLKTAKQSKEAAAKKKKEAALKKKKEAASKLTGKQNGLAFRQAIINNAKQQAKLDQTVLDTSTRLFGIPHQFLSSADMLFASGINLGRKYAETFMVEAPIVNFTPGRPNYMPGMSTAEKQGFLSAFNYKSPSRDTTSILSKMGSNKDVRFFNFYGDYSTYMTYVNLLCRTAALYMGLQKSHPRNFGYTVSKHTYATYDWSKYKFMQSDQTDTSGKRVKDSVFENATKAIKAGAQEVLADIKNALHDKHENVQFYVDPATSFQETATNSTGQSMVEATLSSAEDVSKEIAFLTRATATGGIDALAKSTSAVLDTAFGEFGGNNVFTRLFAAGSSVIKGNNMLFPEIWKGSDYAKSYNITIKLTTPYGTKESVYLNIIVPLMHLICLALPRQSTANSYTTPFIIKASSKGLFSCNMGIVDSLSIEKVQGSYTIDGLPTEVVVQMSLKDLYADLMITPAASPILFFENEGLRDWLVVTCGLDVTKSYMLEKYSAVLLQLFGLIQDIPTTVGNKIVDKVKNLTARFV